MRSVTRTIAHAAVALALVLATFPGAGFVQPVVRLKADPTIDSAAQGVLASAGPAQRLHAAAAKGLEATGAPGLSAAVAVGDELTWAAGFGIADLEHDVPVKAETVFRIASISKPITATAVMQLVERGRVTLSDPIQKYVPAFPVKGEQTITIRHLLTHTSGIRHYQGDEFNHRVSYESIEDAIAIFKDDPLLFSPGTKYSYSTYAYNLLAGVVERASGLAFEQYLRERIWTPAGMSATRLEHPGEVVKGRARPYVRVGGASGRLVNAPMADLSIKWAGGGMISTAADLIRFHIALDNGKLLKADTLEQMYTPERLVDGKAIEYGLGWNVIAKPLAPNGPTTTWIAHSGGATGGTTYLLRDPRGKVAVAILTNVQSAPGLQALALELARVAVEATDRSR
jgi:serine beta-lactamase-like protein LACTB, mitochondrial